MRVDPALIDRARQCAIGDRRDGDLDYLETVVWAAALKLELAAAGHAAAEIRGVMVSWAAKLLVSSHGEWSADVRARAIVAIAEGFGYTAMIGDHGTISFRPIVVH